MGEQEVIRERISDLSATMLRICASLDLDSVLHEIVQGARAETGAGCGILGTVNDAGQVQDLVFSGFTSEEQSRLEALLDASRLFAHFRNLSTPLRLTDVRAQVRALGLSADLFRHKTFLGGPLRHKGLHVGNILLGNKDRGEQFTSDDEEFLVLFASQAAVAIANARTHRAEQRARAHLEALVESSPVGVVVLDAGTGDPVSVNREAERILAELRAPGRGVEQVLEAVTCRLGDGRELAFKELSRSQVPGGAEALHGKEIELSAPDGRSVATLLSMTPVRSDDSEVASVAVTMQDLEPLRELERQRAEFLGMVSHELRAPLTSIKGSADTLLDSWQDLDRAEMREFFRLIVEQTDHMRHLVADLLDAGRIDTGRLSISPEPSQVSGLVDRARNTFLSGGGRHTILIDLPRDVPRVMADRGRIVQVLNNLLSNAARSSPESSPIRVAARCDGAHVAVSISDAGRGVAPERLPYLFRKHADDDRPGIAGGLGLAICKGLVEAHGGRIEAESGGIGQGARFTFTVPVAEDGDDGAIESTAGEQGALRDGPVPGPILVLDDDPQTLRHVRDALSAEGHAVLVTGDHRELARIMDEEMPQLVLLDLMLPGTDGMQLMRDVPELSELPVVFISGYGRDETIAKALEAGAADYIVKPFSATELVARVGAALRRQTEPEPFVLGELVIDYPRHLVTLAGCPVELTATEYKVLRLLSINGARVTTYDALMRQVWGRRTYRNPKLVRAFVKSIRKKLGDDAIRPTYIVNVRGAGYRMARPVDL